MFYVCDLTLYIVRFENNCTKYIYNIIHILYKLNSKISVNFALPVLLARIQANRYSIDFTQFLNKISHMFHIDQL